MNCPAAPWTPIPRLRGYVWACERPVGTLLLQHGFGEYAERFVSSYGGLIPRLNALGLDVYAFDLPGHGGSPGPRGVVDIREAVQLHLAARRAISTTARPLYLFGHSLGGLITAASVAESPEDVDGVVMTSPALLFDASTMARLTGQALAALVPGLAVLPAQSQDGLSALRKVVESVRADERMYRGRVSVLTAVSALITSERCWDMYRDWKTPTLVLHGEADTYTDPRGSALFQAMVGSTVRLVKAPGGRHELFHDTGGAALLDLALDWLGSRLTIADKFSSDGATVQGV